MGRSSSLESSTTQKSKASKVSGGLVITVWLGMHLTLSFLREERQEHYEQVLRVVRWYAGDLLGFLRTLILSRGVCVCVCVCMCMRAHMWAQALRSPWGTSTKTAHGPFLGDSDCPWRGKEFSVNKCGLKELLSWFRHDRSPFSIGKHRFKAYSKPFWVILFWKNVYTYSF